MIKKAIEKFLVWYKRPKCPNGYYCPDCIHHEYIWQDTVFRGIKCRINAR